VRVGALYIAPVKSLALQQVERTTLTKRGLAGDREFFLVNDRDRLVTMRECGPLATVRAAYEAASNILRFVLPDGRVLEGAALSGQPLTARFFGEYDVAGYEVEGPWNDVLAVFTGLPVRVVRAAEKRSGVDAFPVSLLTDASVAELRRTAAEPAIDERRFRPNIYIAAAERPHEEDEWLDREVHIGSATLRVRMRDERCAVTTLNPDTGHRDMNTLRLIANYRNEQAKEVNFGVYATVAAEGEIAVGDGVEPM
jgi:uncharacterized protein YcbX